MGTRKKTPPPPDPTKNEVSGTLYLGNDPPADHYRLQAWATAGRAIRTARAAKWRAKAAAMRVELIRRFPRMPESRLAERIAPSVGKATSTVRNFIRTLPA